MRKDDIVRLRHMLDAAADCALSGRVTQREGQVALSFISGEGIHHIAAE